MKKIFFTTIVAITVLLSGCLTSQFKSYKFTFKDKKNGTLEIVYHNIFADVSDSEDPDSVSQADYQEVIDKYMKGDEIEAGFKNVKVLKKELFEENGTLNARIIVEFQDPADVKLYKYDKNSPWMFKYSSDEKFYSSNGEKKFEDYSIIFWPQNHKETFELTTTISEPDDNDKSLLSEWKTKPYTWRGN